MLKEIAEWKSVRRFNAEPVPAEVLRQVLQAGRRAPSWKNIQPWRFLAVTAEAERSRLGELFSMGVLLRKAPAVILCIGKLDAWDKENQRAQLRELLAAGGAALSDADLDKRFLDHDLARAAEDKADTILARTYENLGIAYAFLLLEAAHLGLGTCIVGEVDNELLGVNQERYQAIKQEFGIGEREIITAAIIVGYPAQEGQPVSPRKPEEEVFSGV